MPFGVSWSPFITHICVDEICKRAIEAGFQVTHYLDDFHYFVRALILEAGYKINMSKEQLPSTTCEALGLHYDLTSKTVQPKYGFLRGLLATLEQAWIWEHILPLLPLLAQIQSKCVCVCVRIVLCVFFV